MNFNIKNTGEVSKEFLNLGINDFQNACTFISKLYYKRNKDKNDILCVFNDQSGTCSTKHATLRKLAIENNYNEIKLILGIFKMDAKYAPKIENTLSTYNLDYIPEAHNYLKINNHYIDVTTPNSQFSDFSDKLIEEYEIEYDEITDRKIEIHKNYLNKWCKKYSVFDLDQIWKIREECIIDLQN